MGSFVAASKLWVVVCRLPRWHSGKEFAYQCKRLRKHRFDPWVGKISQRRKWQPTPVFLCEESHGLRSLAGYSPWGFEELDVTECLSTLTWDRVPWPGMESGPPALGVWSLSHCTTREVPNFDNAENFFFLINFLIAKAFKFHILILMGTIIFKYQELLNCYEYFFFF